MCLTEISDFAVCKQLLDANKRTKTEHFPGLIEPGMKKRYFLMIRLKEKMELKYRSESSERKIQKQMWFTPN